ncbi:MAG: M20 family metallo-hydrolase [Bacteroidetes bacterium]|nr:M20 family metallo-hydrolase [Bacteroidota bacterium]
METDHISQLCIDLLKMLIRTPSISKEEARAANVIRDFLTDHNIPIETHLHNTWCYNKYFDANRPTILLNSHIDTVKPAAGWTVDPFAAIEDKGQLIGLGSNDAGAALVSLLGTFLYFYDHKELPFNICFAATAEEEISGVNGIAAIENITSNCAIAIIGEPTEMKMATAERGLMVVDAITKGKTGHAARNEGVNALYLAMEDIQWIKNFQFEKQDSYLGSIKMTVTMIEAGYQHNVVPDECKYVIDIRTVDTYSYEELLATIQTNVNAKIQARSTRLKPSSIAEDHPIVEAARALGIETFGSSTLSDQALLSIPSIKMGPGKSERSHTPGEFIYISEIEEGIKTYIRLLNELFTK